MENKFKKVIITGPGRSGTSAIAAIFHHLGYFMPDALKLATFEDDHLRRLFNEGDNEAVIIELKKREALHDLIAWKDPKLFGAQGQELASMLNADWLYVFVFRDPLCIALRNNKSRDTEFDDELVSAVKSNVKLAEFYLKVKNLHPTYLISYEKFISDTEVELNALLIHLGLVKKIDLEELANKVLSHKQRYLMHSERKSQTLIDLKPHVSIARRLIEMFFGGSSSK